MNCAIYQMAINGAKLHVFLRETHKMENRILNPSIMVHLHAKQIR